jgi:hypothetical protein
MNTMKTDGTRRHGAVLGTMSMFLYGLAGSALAHEGDVSATTTTSQPPPSAAILQLEDVRRTTARFFDVAQAEAEGYVDIGVFFPNMGWHYLKPDLLDSKFEATQPELLVYADDPCGGPRHLVAVEYAVPLELSKFAPAGFAGVSDVWTANTAFQLWTLHAWVFEFNPDGVFAAYNPRVAP